MLRCEETRPDREPPATAGVEVSDRADFERDCDLGEVVQAKGNGLAWNVWESVVEPSAEAVDAET